MLLGAGNGGFLCSGSQSAANHCVKPLESSPGCSCFLTLFLRSPCLLLLLWEQYDEGFLCLPEIPSLQLSLTPSLAASLRDPWKRSRAQLPQAGCC